MLRSLMTGLLALLFVGQVHAAPEARLDRTRIAEGETVVLIVNVPGDSGGTPDMTGLLKDFDILSHNQSMHMSMINGRSSSSRGWQFVLAPKRTGKLTVPAIRVGGAGTRPLTLEVLPAAEAARLGPVPPVLLEAELEPPQPYVQQKAIYTVRLLSRLPLRQPRISEPQIADAIVEPLGRETEYGVQRDGQQYRVIERRYAVFPQRSGTLEIEGPVLNAQLPEQSPHGNAPGGPFAGRDPFADFDRLFGRGGLPGIGNAFTQTRPVQLRARTLTLDVQPQPAGTPSPWLPAESLTLNEMWSADPPTFRVGEPVTRTIVITAQGLAAAQLPDLTPDAPAGLKLYPDKPQTQSRADGDTLVAQRVLKLAVVPSQSGRVTLPGIRLDWWDTRSRQARVAQLPARDIEVEPAAAVVAGTDSAGGAAPAMRPQQTTVDQLRARDREDAAPAERLGAAWADYWPWIAAVLALAWLATLGLWLHGRRRTARTPVQVIAPAPVARPGLDQALEHLEHACRGNDPAAARRALLAWAAVRWPDEVAPRLEVLAERLGGEAVPVLAGLDHHLYAMSSHPWDGMTAWRQLSPVLLRHAREARAARRDPGLPPLYPQGA